MHLFPIFSKRRENFSNERSGFCVDYTDMETMITEHKTGLWRPRSRVLVCSKILHPFRNDLLKYFKCNTVIRLLKCSSNIRPSTTFSLFSSPYDTEICVLPQFQFSYLVISEVDVLWQLRAGITDQKTIIRILTDPLSQIHSNCKRL
jgi:hypothetical protein